MEGSEFDEIAFFTAIADSNTRALLIGRRALVALGLPVLTADYDFWIHPDDIAQFNSVVKPFGLHPNRDPSEALSTGRYVLENDEHVDVICSRSRKTVGGAELEFDALWSRRVSVDIGDAQVALPALDDLIDTKRLGGRPKDAEDIRLLLKLKEHNGDE